jgi:hypothetical protein
MENNNKFNDLSKVPVELYDDGVNYGMCYTIQAPEKTLRTITSIIDKIKEISGGDAEESFFIPMSAIMNGLIGEGDSDGYVMGYEFIANNSLVILTICRGNAIVPFRDCLLKAFPEIDYIEVLN